jgi:hypothetical protein
MSQFLDSDQYYFLSKINTVVAVRQPDLPYTKAKNSVYENATGKD